MADIRGQSVLVIGGAGFIGSHVVEELLTHDVKQVIVFDNFSRGVRANLGHALKDGRCRVFEAGGDILHADVLAAAVKESDMVVHLAALWLLQCSDFPRVAFDVNIRGTFNVLEACRDHAVRRLVYSSSASVYGDAIEIPMTEEHPFNNRTFYGATKIAGEAMCRAFGERYGLSHCGLRYMNVYGPRQDYLGAYISVIMRILDRLDLGLPPILHGDGLQGYDFVYVTDAASANLCALTSDASDTFYNVGTGTRTSLRDLCEILCELTGCALPTQFEPSDRTFVTNRIGSTVKAERELGFRSTVELREGFRQVVEWRKTRKSVVSLKL